MITPAIQVLIVRQCGAMEFNSITAVLSLHILIKSAIQVLTGTYSYDFYYIVVPALMNSIDRTYLFWLYRLFSYNKILLSLSFSLSLHSYGPYCCPTPEPNCYEVCYEVEYDGKGGKGSKGGYDGGFYYGGKGGKGSKGGYYGSEEECEIICEDDHPPYYPPIRPPTPTGPNCHEVCYEVGGGGSKGSKGGYYEYDEKCEWICYPPAPTADCREVCYEVGGGGSKGGKGGKSSGYYGSYYGGKGGKGGKGHYGFKNEECEWICDPVPTPSCDPRYV
jgi:hypothetical protein